MSATPLHQGLKLQYYLLMFLHFKSGLDLRVYEIGKFVEHIENNLAFWISSKKKFKFAKMFSRV